MRYRSIGATVDVLKGIRGDQFRVGNVRNIHCHPTGSEKGGQTTGQTKFLHYLADLLKV